MLVSKLLELPEEEILNWLKDNKDTLALIPVEKRSIDDKVIPSTTQSMKYSCMGEHSHANEYTCPHCNEDDHEEDECEYCDNTGTIKERHTVPWSLSKDIYNDMCLVAIRDNEKSFNLKKDK